MRTSLSPLQAEFTKTWAFVFKNWIMARRNAFTLLEILFWPVVAFLSVGLLAEFAAFEHEMKAFVLVGIISMSAVQVCQLDVAYGLLYDVWSKAVKHGFIAPVRIRHLVFGSLVVGMARGCAVLLILSGASYFLFDFDFTLPGVVPMFLFLTGMFLCASMVGILVCILVFLFGTRAEVAAWSLVSLMLLLCGIYYPVSILPAWATRMAELVPLTYMLEFYRSYYGFQTGYSYVLIRGYGTALALLLVEVFLMKLALRRAKRTGILLRLSE